MGVWGVWRGGRGGVGGGAMATATQSRMRARYPSHLHLSHSSTWYRVVGQMKVLHSSWEGKSLNLGQNRSGSICHAQTRAIT
jgi:hypothetical protein